MQEASNIAFKEWAVVVEALGGGEQILVLRKGGIREQRGEFHVDHREFWLFPTRYHEAEGSIIASKRPALRELAGRAADGFVDIRYYAVADPVIEIGDPALLGRLQGRHIWSEQVLQERFAFGRRRGLHALLLRVFRRPEAERLPMQQRYGGCSSWVELDREVSTRGLAPVLEEATFRAQRDEICELLNTHAFAHP
jgi:hypothetical protein